MDREEYGSAEAWAGTRDARRGSRWWAALGDRIGHLGFSRPAIPGARLVSVIVLAVLAVTIPTAASASARSAHGVTGASSATERGAAINEALVPKGLGEELSPSRLGEELSPSLPGRSKRHRGPQKGISQTPSKTLPYWACPEDLCEAIIDPHPVRAAGHWVPPTGGKAYEGSGEFGAFSPQDLQSAYKIPTTGGSTQTIALVDAYGYKTAEEDLATYRSTYKLPPCTKAEGCFKVVNQKGEEANYPPEAEEWQLEQALDVDMASAACPSCHILLVQANSSQMEDLGASVNTAVSLGANEISNSYGLAEQRFESESLNPDYNHPGVVITAAAGDSAFDGEANGNSSPWFPAASPYVVSVGGTALRKAANSRGWSEEVWAGSGSGCSSSEQKPAWQTDTGCAHRTDNDVAAVGAVETPVSVRLEGGWWLVAGTSVASPLVAGIEAHASAFARSLSGADGFYSDPSARFDVTAGSNGPCESYLCNAQVGYDGPTGVGSPNGPLELTSLPPIVATRVSTGVTETAATLNGAIDPQGSETTYHFEYGTSTSYGTSTGSASAGSGTAQKTVSQALTGLQPNTTYHYRLVATSATGTSEGEDSVFRTAAPTVTGVAPNIGPAKGSTSVTITGTNFAGVSAVKFGTTNAKSFVVSSETSISAVSPEGSGTVDVTVTTPWGTTPTGSTDHFVYERLQWSLGELTVPKGAVVGANNILLAGVSCVSSKWCVGAGLHGPEPKRPYVQLWNGSRWTLQELPEPGTAEAPAGITEAIGVSCTSTQACTAVGLYQPHGSAAFVPLVERWNGNEWSVQSVPYPSEAKSTGLTSVSCFSPTECMAVGSTTNGAGTTVPYAVRWKQGTWIAQELKPPPEAPVVALRSISCTSATWCIAAGFVEHPTSESRTQFGESWNGSEWSINSPTTPPGARIGAEGLGVSCTSPSACTWAGYYLGEHPGSTGAYFGSLIERWNGTEWSIQSFERPGVFQDGLMAVSCSTPESCTAVGAYEIQQHHWVAMVEQWNGERWRVQRSPAEASPYRNELFGVSCVGESSCATVGNYVVGGYWLQLGMTRSETSMGVQSTPSASGATHGLITGDSCASSTACIAVGSYQNSSGTTVSLADAWNGVEWKTQATPNPPGAKATELRRVSCTSPSECTAVGAYTNSSGTIATLAERFNGTKWEVQSTANPNGAKESRLSGVSCTSPTSCSAVGFYKNGGGSPFLSFAESWNGKEWKLQTTENPLGATKVQLLGVSCSASSACTAVGTYTNSASEALSLTERLSGNEWKIQSTPNPSGGKGVELSGVSCPQAASCTAVGSYTNGSGNSASFAESWNGTEWQLQAMQSPAGAVQSKILGVSCTALGACTAVGWSKQGTGNATPLAELWNGREWLPWSAPSPSSEGGELRDISCISMYACEAAGTYTNSSKVQVSLAEGLGAPGASTRPATSITASTATLAGFVAPNQWTTTYHFEYGETTSYGTSVPVSDVGLLTEAGEEAQQVATNLKTKTSYHFRLVAKNFAGTTFGEDQSFTTP
jgi:hypothetical protein